MGFKEEYAKLELKQEELFKEQHELITNVLKENGGKIVDSRVLRNVQGEEEFDDRVCTTIFGKREPKVADIYGIKNLQSGIVITGYDKNGVFVTGLVFPENLRDVLQFINNYFEQ